MLKIDRFTVEGLAEGCVTDESSPVFAFSLLSDTPGAALQSATLKVGDWQTTTTEQTIPCTGAVLLPQTQYTATLTATATTGESATAELSFETGLMGGPFGAEWITDGAYKFTEEKVSPKPMVFRREFALDKPVASARIYATAMGIYELELNGEKVGNEYFAPGFTSYKTRLQYQTYDVTAQLQKSNTLLATVAGGWAVGSFIYSRKNRVTADRQALMLALEVKYADGSTARIATDEAWQVTEDGPCRMADLYDGETWDATVDLDKAAWRSAVKENLRVNPQLVAACGAPVVAHEALTPTRLKDAPDGELIFDFGQNFAGVIELELNGKAGQTVKVRHAEILQPDGSLNTVFLRTAKATATYTCRNGAQRYSPRFSYMGFRYIGVSGIAAGDFTVKARVLYSDIEQIGSFECSDPMLNRLQQNIVWSSRSNFMDIPTDCPQRDERMGWTGDIAVFAPTACYNFEMGRFLRKWLLDVKAEQLKTGGLPNTVPKQGFGFPTTMPEMAIAWWGDACVLVPWAMYMASGNAEILRTMYPTMKKYVDACRFWAGLGFGKKRYIWSMPAMLSFGDWVAPDVPKMQQWQARNPWTGTASLRNTSATLARIAGILGESADAAAYRELSDKTADAYISVFTEDGKLKEEFQTGYVLPLYFDMFPEAERRKAADNLARLVEENGWRIGTGFPGTPYILFALADNGHPDTAYKMLLNTACPSWLYEVKMGATTIWERWDGLSEDGTCPISDDGTDMMISYNHYASGAVGDFLYRRTLGLEPTAPGYRQFTVKPLVGGGLSYAKGSVRTPYGVIEVEWRQGEGKFTLDITVPMGTACTATLPSGKTQTLQSGRHTLAE